MTILFDKYKNPNEQLDIEFKQFCIKNNLYNYLNRYQIKCIITTGIWNINFNKLIIDNFYNYLEIFIPKYIAQFVNKKIEGKLIFGINNDGKITGIPSKKKIYKKNICKDIRRILEFNNNFDTSNNINDIMKNIKINIIKLNINESLLTDEAKILYESYNNTCKLNELNYQIYKEKYNSWLEIYNLYRTRLNDIINNSKIREELIDYIIDNIDINYDFDKIFIIFDHLNSNQYIDVKKICNNSVYSFKNNIYHISYWLCRFQQEMIDSLQLIKPIKPIKIKSIAPETILTRLTDLASIFIKNNKIIYYLIEIKININKNIKLKNDIKIYQNGKYVYMKRSMFRNEPCTEYCEIKSKFDIIIKLNIIIIILILNLFFYKKVLSLQ